MPSHPCTITSSRQRSRAIAWLSPLLTVSVLSVAVFIAAPVLLADRLADKDIKALIERINEERDRFEDQLDGKIKGSVLRGPGGEVNVERFLDDLQDNVNRMKERFAPEYAASAEVTTVLRQSSDIHRFMSKQPSNLDGASEWTRLSGSLTDLAAAYGTTLPLPEGQQARRMNDREVSKAADELAKSADRFKKDLDTAFRSDKTVAPTTRDAALRAADDLKKHAEDLADVVGDGRPASGEAKALIDHAAKIRSASSGRPLSPAAQTSWTAVESSLDLIAQGFRIPAR